jgi:Tfp pilus assembly protein PilF
MKAYARCLSKWPGATPGDKIGALLIPQMMNISRSYPKTDAGRAAYVRDAIKAYGPHYIKNGVMDFKEYAKHPYSRFMEIKAEDIPKHKRLASLMDQSTLYKLDGHPEKALELSLKVAEEMPSYSEYQATVGDCYFDMGKMPEAIKYFNKAIAINPRDPYNYYSRAVAHTQDGQYEKAIDDYRTGSKYDGERNPIIDEIVRTVYGSYLLPTEGERYLRMGKLYIKLKDYDAAVKELSTAIAKQPRYDDAYLARADAYKYLKNLDAAQSDYDSILKFNPEDEGTYKERGELYMLRGKYELAIADFTKVIKLDPKESWRAYESRAKAYDKMGKKPLLMQTGRWSRSSGLAQNREAMGVNENRRKNGNPSPV